MPLIVALAGSPHPQSRSTRLLDTVTGTLRANGLDVTAYGAGDFPPEVLLRADFNHAMVRRLQEDVARADGLVIATPVYKAAYSGVLKLLLDLLPARALERALVLPLATCGSPSHLLAIDYALRPVLASLKARQVIDGVYATERELVWGPQGDLQIPRDVRRRLAAALGQFVRHLPHPPVRDLDLSSLYLPDEEVLVAGPQPLVRMAAAS